MWTKDSLVLWISVCFLFVECLASISSRKEGKKRVNDGRRIMEGMTAEPEEFKYLVHLQGDWGRRCGAAVISNFFIITGAHCIWDLPCDTLRVFPSTWKKGDQTKYHIEKCYQHEKYDPTGLAYDIALVKTLEDLLDCGEFDAIMLPASEEVFAPGVKATIVGWGKTEAQIYENILLRGQVEVLPWEHCDWKFREIDPNCKSKFDCPVKQIPKRTLCTHSDDLAVPAVCYGDSGGPLVIDGAIAGIVCATIVFQGRCEPGSPTMHTDVSDYLPWIYAIIEPSRDTSWMKVQEEP